MTAQRQEAESEFGARQRSIPALLSELAPTLFTLGESPQQPSWVAYIKGAVIVGAITGLGLLMGLRQASTNAAMLYLLAIVFGALRWGFEPAVFLAISSAIVFDYLFVPPYLSFAVNDTWYLISLLSMTFVGIVVSVLAAAAREQTLSAKERAAHVAVLYSLTQSLSAVRGVDQVVRTAAEHIQAAFGLASAILLSPGNGGLVLRYQTPGRELDAETRSKAGSILRRQFDGFTSQNHGAFLPLKCGDRVIGMIVLLPTKTPPEVSIASKRVLEGVAGQVALAIERAELEEHARETDILRKANELHKTLLNSVSHSLRAPLAAVLSALDPIVDRDAETNSAGVVELARIAQAEAYRLDHLVGNLLDLSRLEAGALRPKREPHDVENLVGTALGELRLSQTQRIESIVQPDLPAVFVDFALMVRVLVNLLENALKYSPVDLSVHLEARGTNGQVEIRISDCGCGVPATERERIFHRFFRGTRSEDAPGVGLGLAVSKGFVEAHNGKIWLEERPGGGSVFCFTMPLVESASKI